jgi:integrase
MQQKRSRIFHEAIEKYTNEYPLDWAIISSCHKVDREFGGFHLTKITPEMVSNWKASRLREASPATVIREVSIIKKVFKLAARDWGWIGESLVQLVSMPKRGPLRVRWLTVDEETALVSACPPWLANIVQFLIQTGLRRTECITLCWSDINLQEGYFTLLKTKEKLPRSIPLSPKARAIIDSIMAPSNAKYVFVNGQGQRITANHIEYEFRKAVIQSGLQDLHLHDLRHTTASRLVQRGCPLEQVQKILGHSSLLMTLRYAHLDFLQIKSALSESV